MSISNSAERPHRTGYEKHVKSYKEPVQSAADIILGAPGADGADMTGKVVVITGANSGIGKELATYAAAKGATLYMLCRSQGRAEEARDDIVAKTKNPNVNILLVDVAELSQIKSVAAELQAKEDRVDCVFCNAGVLLNDRTVNKEGVEATFASHLLGGSFLLPQLLMPLLKKSDEPRVIFTTSGGMLTTKFPDWETATNTNETKYDGTNAYAYAKRGQVLLAEEWAKSIPEVTFLSAHPGWAATNAVDEAFGDNKKYLEPLRTTWQGAEGMCWLMATGKSNLKSGGFYLDRKPQKKHMAGPFMTEGGYTKNTPAEVEEMMKKLKALAGL
jgi:dehydrogenase/reductase SDR family member 12